jgi:DNA primase
MKPAEAAVWLEGIEETDFTAPPRRELYRVAAEGARAGRGADASVSEALSEDARMLFTELAVGADDLALEADAERVREVFVRLQVFRLERDIKGRRNVLQDINPLYEPQRHDELFTELVRLEARRRDLLRSLSEGAA